MVMDAQYFGKKLEKEAKYQWELSKYLNRDICQPEGFDAYGYPSELFKLDMEINFYGGGGSKLNETARSYKMLSQEADTIDGFTFVWFTDGIGWKSARGNLRETFEVMDTIYSIDDMENGVMEIIF